MSFSSTIARTWAENRLFSALLELTYACNLDCDFCYNDRSLGGERLTLDQYRTLLQDLAALGVLNLSLTGGEPLAHPKFFEIASHARELGFATRIKTNGHGVSPRVSLRIREEIDPFIVEVSIHGASADTHDRQTRVPGSFERLLANLAGMKAAGLRVQANSVLTRWNEQEVESLLSLCERLEVRLQIDPEVKPRDDGDRAPLRIQATPEGNARYARALDARRAGRHADDVRVTERTASVEPAKHCGAGSNTIAVDPYGRVLPCVQWRVPVGNLHEQRITEIWASSSGLDHVRNATREVSERLASFGEAGKAARFCPGAAHTYSGDAVALYPPAQRRIEESGRTRVRLTVV